MKRIRELILFLTLLHGITPLTQAQGGQPPPTPAAESDLPPIPKVHVVQQGESLTTIATLYDTTVEALQAANHMTEPSWLSVGQELVIPGVAGEPAVATYVVQVGDTLPGLAAAYNTTVAAIAQSIHVIHPASLVAGQTITVARPLPGR